RRSSDLRLLAQSSRQILRIGPLIRGALGIAPDLPRRRGPLQLVLEPDLLFGAKNRLRRCVPLRVGRARTVERDLSRRLAGIESAATIENLRRILGKHPRELRTELSNFRVAERVRVAIAVLVGDDEIEVLAVA